MNYSKEIKLMRKVLFWIVFFLSILVSIFNNLHYMENNLVEYSLVSLFAFLIALSGFIKKILIIYIEGVYRNTGKNYVMNVEKYERKYRAVAAYMDTISLSLDISFFISLLFMVLSTLDVFDILTWSMSLSHKYLGSFNHPWLVQLGDITINMAIILTIYYISLQLEKVVMHLANRWLPRFKHTLDEL